MDVETALAAGATIGESPTWDERDGALYWMDVKAPALHRFDPASGARRSWPLSADVGAFALTRDSESAVVFLRSGVFRLGFAGGELTRLADPPYDPSLFRFNEGACDETGRFWVGVMFDPLDRNATPQKESLHSYTLDEGLRQEPDAAELHNGMAWSVDGATFYLSHSQSGTIYAFNFHAREGRIGRRRVFATVDPSHGLPDGAAVDADNGYWCALHGGRRLRRYAADGAIDRDVDLPVSQPTMPAFAGPGLADLYVTSAADGLSPQQREAEPLAGALLRLRPAVAGAARRCAIR